MPSAAPPRPAPDAPPLCPACRRETADQAWALCGQVRGALLSVSRGGATGLVLHHFDDALLGLERLAAIQEQGLLRRPPEVAELRERLLGARYAVVSAALAARTSPFRCVSGDCRAAGWSDHPCHAPVVEELLGQLARLEPAPIGAVPAAEAPPPRAAEQRSEPRRPVRLAVVVIPGDLNAEATDLSRRGGGFRLPRLLEAGARVRVRFCRRCGVAAEGEVRWAVAAGAGGRAGVRFAAPLPLDVTALAA